MESSETGLSAARQALTSRISAIKEAKILGIIFYGHCTPVEGVEEGGLVAPAWLYAHVQIEVNLHAEQFLHFHARQSADFDQYGALFSDEDGLLPGPLHSN